MKGKQEVAFFWFRRDLRLKDNVGLKHALLSGYPVQPVFIFDTEILSHLSDRDDARVSFIHQTIRNLSCELEKIGSSLLVKYGKPSEIWKELTESWNIRTVFANKDYEPYGKKRDQEVQVLLASTGISFQLFRDHIIFEPGEIVTAAGNFYTVFTPFMKRWKEKFQQNPIEPVLSENHLESFNKTSPFYTPSLEETGFQKSKIEVPVLHISEEVIGNYHNTRNLPGHPAGTTGLSAHLRFGTIGIRELTKIARKLNDNFLTELIWREFFVHIMAGFPDILHQGFKREFEWMPWENDEEKLIKWTEGKTGFPIVDAGMRELAQTGLMHNRVRMITASFLVKHLLIDWRWGEAWFARKLLDFDLSANNGNWQWVAGCGCDAAPYFRIFNPQTQQERFDPDLVYVKKWVPEYNTPDYPAPMVDHKMARARALKAYEFCRKKSNPAFLEVSSFVP